jgi:hypothetical protein
MQVAIQLCHCFRNGPQSCQIYSGFVDPELLAHFFKPFRYFDSLAIYGGEVYQTHRAQSKLCNGPNRTENGVHIQKLWPVTTQSSTKCKAFTRH